MTPPVIHAKEASSLTTGRTYRQAKPSAPVRYMADKALKRKSPFALPGVPRQKDCPT